MAVKEAVSLIHSARWNVRETLDYATLETDRDTGEIVAVEFKGKAKARQGRYDAAAYDLLRAAWTLRGKPGVAFL